MVKHFGDQSDLIITNHLMFSCFLFLWTKWFLYYLLDCKILALWFMLIWLFIEIFFFIQLVYILRIINSGFISSWRSDSLALNFHFFLSPVSFLLVFQLLVTGEHFFIVTLGFWYSRVFIHCLFIFMLIFSSSTSLLVLSINVMIIDSFLFIRNFFIFSFLLQLRV